MGAQGRTGSVHGESLSQLCAPLPCHTVGTTQYIHTGIAHGPPSPAMPDPAQGAHVHQALPKYSCCWGSFNVPGRHCQHHTRHRGNSWQQQLSQTVPSILSSSSTVEGTQIIIKDVLPSSRVLQSTFCPVAAWPSVPVVCGWLCRVCVVLLTHTRCHFPSPAGHTIAMLPLFYHLFHFLWSH